MDVQDGADMHGGRIAPDYRVPSVALQPNRTRIEATNYRRSEEWLLWHSEATIFR